MRPITKSAGVTPTEQLLASLCEQSFLALWSYPNPFRDDGKELCDLLAVFENHVFLFFDRESRQFDKPGSDQQISWERWKREAIDAQIRSVRGAERYVRQQRGVFLDSALTTPFPLSIQYDSLIVHKIIVAHGAKEACASASDMNVYGSLGISYSDPPHDDTRPFLLSMDRGDPIHVFDSHNLSIVLHELDTVYDFTRYLDAKMDAIRKYKALTYCGEEDLLAHYFYNLDESSGVRSIGPKNGAYDHVHVGEGEWKDFITLPQYDNKERANQVSYVWDDLIQKTCRNALNGTLLGNSTLLQGEKSAIHEMAKETRFARRMLGQRMMEAIAAFPKTGGGFGRRYLSFMSSPHDKNRGYLFLQVSVLVDKDYNTEYRPFRQAMLEAACGVAKLRFPHLQSIIGIAIDGPALELKRNSEDFILMEFVDWNAERQAHYEDVNRVMRFFDPSTLKRHEGRMHEFPLDDFEAPTGR